MAQARLMGLGPLPTCRLPKRGKPRQRPHLVRQGRGPDRPTPRERRAAAGRKRGLNTFAEWWTCYIAAHEASWRNAKHRQQWRNTLDAYAAPMLGKLGVVAMVDTGAVMGVLEPIWREKPETASRLRGRIEAVLDYATARGWRTGENPARWRGHLANLLPARGKIARVEHHAALPWREMGAFMAELAKQDGIAALALRFTI